MKLSDDMAAFVAALGRREGDSEILPAVAVLAVPFETEVFDSEPRATYYSFWKRGVEFLFESDVLEAVNFFLRDPEDADYEPFDGLADLWPELADTPDRATLVGILGTPSDQGRDTYPWLLYECEGWYLRAELDRQDRIRRLTLLYSAP